MKAVILAGGKGTRLSEETLVKPKPMIEIGGKPIIWHIMKMYSEAGINDFIVCLGYLGYKIKEYFFHYQLHNADVTIDTRRGMVIHESSKEDWRITLVETGENTMTGGRLKRIASYLDGSQPFCMTYGDGVSDVDIRAAISFHENHGKLATVTAVTPLARFGSLDIRKDGAVRKFVEKPVTEGGLINGGFFVLSQKALEYIDGEHTLWEKEPLENLAKEGQLMAFEHRGFWQPMDTLRDRNTLEDLWNSGAAPWKTWQDNDIPLGRVA